MEKLITGVGGRGWYGGWVRRQAKKKGRRRNPSKEGEVPWWWVRLHLVSGGGGGWQAKERIKKGRSGREDILYTRNLTYNIVHVG